MVIAAKSRAFEVSGLILYKSHKIACLFACFVTFCFDLAKLRRVFLYYRRCERVCRSLVAVCALGGEITLCAAKALCGAFWALSRFPIRKGLSEIRAAFCPAMPCCSGL